MSPFHPIEPIPAGIANGRRRARRAVPTAKGERRLWVQLGDFRRKAQQWGGCADSGPSRPRPGMRRFDPNRSFAVNRPPWQVMPHTSCSVVSVGPAQ